MRKLHARLVTNFADMDCRSAVIRRSYIRTGERQSHILRCSCLNVVQLPTFQGEKNSRFNVGLNRLWYCLTIILKQKREDFGTQINVPLRHVQTKAENHRTQN